MLHIKKLMVGTKSSFSSMMAQTVKLPLLVIWTLLNTLFPVTLIYMGNLNGHNDSFMSPQVYTMPKRHYKWLIVLHLELLGLPLLVELCKLVEILLRLPSSQLKLLVLLELNQQASIFQQQLNNLVFIVYLLEWCPSVDIHQFPISLPLFNNKNVN